MRYSFAPPEGWSRSPFPPPQRGVYLRAPVPLASPDSASILLFEALAPQGTLEEQLAAMVKQGCEGVKVAKSGKPEAKKTRSFKAIGVQVVVEVPAEKRTREEQRVFVLVETGEDRLPVAFVGGAKALATHQKAFDALLGSIGHLLVEPSFYTRWVE
jgi:hypothetical protein